VQLATVTVDAASDVSVAGLAATGSVGTVTVDAASDVSVAGLAATGSVGTVTVDAASDVSVTGLAATGAVGYSFGTNGSSSSSYRRNSYKCGWFCHGRRRLRMYL
jgi:hypothetical protein